MIPFNVPLKYKVLLETGKIVRYGTVLKDLQTGQIVGHLKEVGNLPNIMSSMPLSLDPLSSLSNIAQNLQLQEISQNLEVVKMISSVGAVASVATLGVSVAGFAIVTQKLNKISERVNIVLEEVASVKEIVEELNMKQEILEFADVKTASEQLHNALFTEDIQRRKDLLTQSNQTFHKYKNYYLKMAQNQRLWLDGKLPIEIANELYSRFITCAIGQLYSEFLLGDLTCFRETWKLVNQEVQEVSEFDKIKVLRAKSDNCLNNYIGLNYDELKPKILFTYDMLIETRNRIETMDYEAQYLEQNNLDPYSYLKELRMLDDGIIVIPNSNYDNKI